jgi:uncharacterized protein
MGRKGAEVADHSNVWLIRDAYEAFEKGDMEVVGKVLADDLVLRWPGRNPLAGVRHSKAEFFELLGVLAEQTSGTFGLEVEDIIGGGESVVAFVTYHAERNGKTLTYDALNVWRVENGMAVEMLFLASDPYAVDEFWS